MDHFAWKEIRHLFTDAVTVTIAITIKLIGDLEINLDNFAYLHISKQKNWRNRLDTRTIFLECTTKNSICREANLQIFLPFLYDKTTATAVAAKASYNGRCRISIHPGLALVLLYIGKLKDILILSGLTYTRYTRVWFTDLEQRTQFAGQ